VDIIHLMPRCNTDSLPIGHNLSLFLNLSRKLRMHQIAMPVSPARPPAPIVVVDGFPPSVLLMHNQTLHDQVLLQSGKFVQ
jgi:hypothetical protein